MTSSTTESMPLLHERYELVRALGRGGQGRTWLARDHGSGEEVVVKELLLRLADDWKAIELFEREGRVLGALDHPQIPDYVDAWVDDADGEACFFLAQQYVAGEPLDRLVARGARLDEDAAVALLDQLLGVLDYLAGLRPPVVHRDIKPGNIIRRDDGTYVLVDFGAVQAIVPPDTGGSTVVGTAGYLPVEQLMGRAQPSSDLYALAATVVHLMSGRHPNELAAGGIRLDFRDHLDCSPGFADLLDAMLAPYPEDRVAGAAEARARLAKLSEQDAAEARTAALAVAEPRALVPVVPERVEALVAAEPPPKRLDVRVVADELVLRILPVRLVVVLSIFFLAAGGVTLYGALTADLGFLFHTVIFWVVAFGLPVVTGGTDVTIDERRVCVEYRIFGKTWRRIRFPRAELDDVVLHGNQIRLLRGVDEHTLWGFHNQDYEARLYARRVLRGYLGLEDEDAAEEAP